MSKIDVVHTDHIKPAQLETLVTDLLAKSQELMAANPEEGTGWLLVNAAQALRKYNDILKAAYLQSLREGYGGGVESNVIQYRNANLRNS